MSADLPSSNPFRKKAPVVSFVGSKHPSTRDLPPLDTSNLYEDSAPPVKTQKNVKKVRIQSPHSPGIPAPEAYFSSASPSEPEITRFPELRDDSFEDQAPEVIRQETSVSGTASVSGSQAPANPFARTLATIEHTNDASGNHEGGAATKATGRAPMDVNAFTRQLLSGTKATDSSGSSASLPSGISFGMNDTNSTDTSSTSKQSMSETTKEAQPDSLGSSNQYSDAEEERTRTRSDSTGTIDRKKPPPPSSRHGKLLKAEVGKDTDISTHTQSNTITQHSELDAHESLSIKPQRSNHESESGSMANHEPLGRTPEPPSPTQSMQRKGPPPPPARRYSQLVADSKLSGVSSGRLSPNFEEEAIASPPPARQISSPANSAPPPPPTRRPVSLRNASYGVPPQSPSVTEPERPAPVTWTSSSSAPMPPPSRHSSIRHATSSHNTDRPSSVRSFDMSTPRRPGTATPPAPPPPRHRASSRNSMDASSLKSPASTRTSGEYFHRRSGESARRESFAISEDDETDRKGSDASSALSDLARLQREIEELRRQSERSGSGS